MNPICKNSSPMRWLCVLDGDIIVRIIHGKDDSIAQLEKISTKWKINGDIAAFGNHLCDDILSTQDIQYSEIRMKKSKILYIPYGWWY